MGVTRQAAHGCPAHLQQRHQLSEAWLTYHSFVVVFVGGSLGFEPPVAIFRFLRHGHNRTTRRGCSSFGKFWESTKLPGKLVGFLFCGLNIMDTSSYGRVTCRNRPPPSSSSIVHLKNFLHGPQSRTCPIHHNEHPCKYGKSVNSTTVHPFHRPKVELGTFQSVCVSRSLMKSIASSKCFSTADMTAASSAEEQAGTWIYGCVINGCRLISGTLAYSGTWI